MSLTGIVFRVLRLRVVFVNHTSVPTLPTHPKGVFLNAISVTMIATKQQIVSRFVSSVTP